MTVSRSFYFDTTRLFQFGSRAWRLKTEEHHRLFSGLLPKARESGMSMCMLRAELVHVYVQGQDGIRRPSPFHTTANALGHIVSSKSPREQAQAYDFAMMHGLMASQPQTGRACPH